MIRRPAWLELSDQGGGEGRWGWTGRHLNCTQMFGRPQGKLTGRWGFKAGTWSDVIRSTVKVERSVGYHLTCPASWSPTTKEINFRFSLNARFFTQSGTCWVSACHCWSAVERFQWCRRMPVILLLSLDFKLNPYLHFTPNCSGRSNIST